MVRFPTGFRLERLGRKHPRGQFRSGEEKVDHWLARNALQQQEKHLSVTKVLLDDAGAIAGYYTLATSQIDFSALPAQAAKRLPRRALPVATLAWLGVDASYQGQGLGERLMAQALWDCAQAGEIFAFVAVIVDCINEAAKTFYLRWDFKELPGHPYRLYLSAASLSAVLERE
jgi:GNAT superfamily N-acetyltransferase